jgi:hypothetical protein
MTAKIEAILTEAAWAGILYFGDQRDTSVRRTENIVRERLTASEFSERPHRVA